MIYLRRTLQQPVLLVIEAVVGGVEIPGGVGLQEPLEEIIASVEVADCSLPLVEGVQGLDLVESAWRGDLGRVGDGPRGRLVYLVRHGDGQLSDLGVV